MPNFCQKCGNLVDDSYAFCNACGAKIDRDYSDDNNKTVTAQDNPYAYTPQQPAQQPVQQPAYQQPVQQPVYQQQPAYQQQPPVYQQPQAPNPYQYNPAPVNVGQVGGYPAPQMPVTPPKKKKTGLIIGLSVAALAIVGAVLVVFVFDVFGLFKQSTSSPKDCIETFLYDIADKDIDGALDCIYETKYSDLMRSVLKQQMKSDPDMLSGLTDANITKDNIKDAVEITVTDEKEVDSAKEKEYKELLSSMTVPVDKIETIETAKVKMQNKQKDTSDEKEFVFVKAEGKWYILATAMGM